MSTDSRFPISDSRLIFFGTAGFSVPALEALLKAGFNIIAVITKPDKPGGRGQKIIVPTVKTIAEKHGLKVFQPLKFKDINEELAGLKPDAGVVVAFGKIIPQSAIDLFPKGLINTHASLLPKYRGPAPIEAAILNGDRGTGITLMQIDAGMDTGPVYVSEKLDINNQNRWEMYEKLSRMGAEMLVKFLPSILSGKLQPKPQDDSKASVVSMISKAEAEIDWNKPSKEIERKIRAHLGWPGSKTKLGGVEVTITAAHVGEPGPKDLAKNGLVIDKLKPAGKKEMTGQAFLAGHKL